MIQVPHLRHRFVHVLPRAGTSTSEPSRATGRQLATLGIHVWRVADGRLVEGWEVTDVLTPAPSSP
jgi:hypothetical protein